MTWLALAAGLVWIARRVLEFFGAEATLNRWRLREAERRGQEAVEAERLEATYRRIEAERPVSQAEALARELNRRFGQPPKDGPRS